MKTALQASCILTMLLLSLDAPAQAPGESPGNPERTGHFQLRHTARELIDADAHERLGEVIDIDAPLQWKVFVPTNYDPATPPGLLVYISPSRRGDVPSGWAKVLAERNLIWVSEDESGNRERTPRRMLTAALGPRLVGRHYPLDTRRIYVAGFSGGGKVAGLVADEFAKLFKGAIYIGGAERWTADQPKHFDAFRAGHYVFVTGSRDFNRKLTRRIHSEYDKAGISNLLLIDVPGMSHELPGAAHWRRALQFLDSRWQPDAVQPRGTALQ